VFFAGEVLDVDGLCGGFNLGWCLFSAARVAESL
jgi:predicted flavoprotein YhiN